MKIIRKKFFEELQSLADFDNNVSCKTLIGVDRESENYLQHAMLISQRRESVQESITMILGILREFRQ